MDYDEHTVTYSKSSRKHSRTGEQMETGSDSSSGISFSVIGSDGEQIGPLDMNEIDIREILQKKFDTDETESSGDDHSISPTRSPRRPSSLVNYNDSGIELPSPDGSGSLRISPNQTPKKTRLLPHMSDLLLAKLAADSSYHNTGRFPSHDSYDSDSSSDYEIPLRSIHNAENPTSKTWYKVCVIIFIKVFFAIFRKHFKIIL